MAFAGYGKEVSKPEDDEKLVFSQPRARGQRYPLYSRTWNRSREDLETAVMQLYGLDSRTNHALILPSGMGAIGALISSVAAGLAGETWTLVHGDELYCEVARTVRYVSDTQGKKMSTCAVDIREHSRLRSLFAEKGAAIRLFHFESCTNPSGQLMDFAFLKELRHLAPHCIFACDNTWLSGALFNPFEHGADIVVESMTKYVSAGRCIGGFVAGASSLMAPVLSWIKAFGVFVGADHCEIFSQGLQTINRRMTATSATAEALAAYLEAHPAVNRVMYPMLSSHPTYHLARLYLTRGGPGCIWFHVSASKKTVMSVLTRSDGPGCGGPECKTSFGAASSRVDPWPQPAPSDACDWPRARAAQGLPGTWIRLAVGHAEALEKTKTAVEVLLAQLCPMATATSTAATQSSKEDRQEDALQPEAHSMRWKRRS